MTAMPAARAGGDAGEAVLDDDAGLGRDVGGGGGGEEDIGGRFAVGDVVRAVLAPGDEGRQARAAKLYVHLFM